jgi:hypothetical protein
MTQAKSYKPCKIFFAVVGKTPTRLVAGEDTSDGKSIGRYQNLHTKIRL